MRAPGGGGAPLAWVWGVRGGALSHARRLVLGGCGRGPLPTGCGCGKCGRGDPSPTPLRALLRAGFARHGGASCLRLGRLGSGASPRPTAHSWGVGPGPATHWLWARGVWAWGPVTYPTARALASWLCALWGRHEGTRRGQVVPACGASGVVRPPTPDHPSLGRVAGARYPLAVGAGGVGAGTRHLPHSARSCELALPAVGAARGRPEGAPLASMWGVQRGALSLRQPPVLGACG